jgi:hypothetical protein
MADVFISYKREDRPMAERLSIALEQLGFDVWWDFELLSGQRYRRVIEEVMDKCAAAVVLWSALARESEFILDEAAYAKDQGKLCPARIDDCRLPLGFGNMHTDDLTGWSGELTHPGLSGLLRALEDKSGKKARIGGRTEAIRDQTRARDLENYKAAQVAGSTDALRAYLRLQPNGMFAEFVTQQLIEMKGRETMSAATPAFETVTAPVELPHQPAPTRSAPKAAEPDPTRTISAARKVSPPKSSSSWRVLGILGGLAGVVALGVVVAPQFLPRPTPAAAPSTPTVRTSFASATPTQAAVAPERIVTRNIDAELGAVRTEERNNADDRAFRQARSTKTLAAIDNYLQMYPSGRNAAAARSLRADLAELEAAAADSQRFDQARTTNTVAAYQAYLSQFPDGRHASKARSTIAILTAPLGTPNLVFEFGGWKIRFDSNTSYGGTTYVWAGDRGAKFTGGSSGCWAVIQNGGLKDFSGCRDVLDVTPGTWLTPSEKSATGHAVSFGSFQMTGTIPLKDGPGISQTTRLELSSTGLVVRVNQQFTILFAPGDTTIRCIENGVRTDFRG